MRVWVRFEKWDSWYELEGDVFTGRWHSSRNHNCSRAPLVGRKVRPERDTIVQVATPEQAKQFVADFVKMRLRRAMGSV